MECLCRMCDMWSGWYVCGGGALWSVCIKCVACVSVYAFLRGVVAEYMCIMCYMWSGWSVCVGCGVCIMCVWNNDLGGMCVECVYSVRLCVECVCVCV